MPTRTTDATTDAARRSLLITGALGASAAALGWPGAARADSWPSRPVRWVVAYPAGGGSDSDWQEF